MFAILQKYDFSSKSQLVVKLNNMKSVVCDTAKVRFFKQITTTALWSAVLFRCLRYCKSTIFQANHNIVSSLLTNWMLFAILQKYDFSSKSQQIQKVSDMSEGCLRYCKSTIFQANHNKHQYCWRVAEVVCDTAKVRFFKQITTPAMIDAYPLCCLRYCKSTIFQANHNAMYSPLLNFSLFAILQKYDFSSKSQLIILHCVLVTRCLRYCKSTIFQANHNSCPLNYVKPQVVCDTAKVRFFKQITTILRRCYSYVMLFAILQKYDFSSKSQL